MLDSTGTEPVEAVVVVLWVNGTAIEVQIVCVSRRVEGTRPVVTVRTYIVVTTAIVVASSNHAVIT